MNLLSSADLSKEEIEEMFELAEDIKSGKEGLMLKDHSTVALFFEKPSTRTRVSFEVAADQLSGSSIYINTDTTHHTRGEELGDTAKVLGLYCDFIVVRIEDHEGLLTMAKNSKVPVINALTHLEHPTQALADCYTMIQYKKSMKKLRVAFMGDIAANTANSLMLTAVKLGAEMSLVGPKNKQANTFYFNKAREYGTVEMYDSVEDGLEGADVVYTDTFVSMGDEGEAESRKKMFAPYQLNSQALSYAKSDSIVMHCLPAHRGEEITAEVLDGPRSVVWEQAANKLIIEKAILLYLSEKS